MMHSMLASVIDYIFEKEVGRWQSDKPLDERKGLAVTINLNIPYENGRRVEEGYRYADMVIYGYSNYVTVLTRTRANVAPIDEKDRVGEYEKSATEWEVQMHHDSCWRDAVRNFFFDNEQNASVLGHTSFKGDFLRPYNIVPLRELLENGVKIEQEIKEAKLREKYPNLFKIA